VSDKVEVEVKVEVVEVVERVDKVENRL